MNQKHFRLGNLINIRYAGFDDSPSYFQINSIQLLDLEGIEKYPDNYAPIELTEGWLLKFGFRIIHVKNTHFAIRDPNGVAGNYMIHIFPTLNNQWHIAFSDNVRGKEIDYSPTTKIKYVHQLQNLFFALTGEELTEK